MQELSAATRDFPTDEVKSYPRQSAQIIREYPRRVICIMFFFNLVSVHVIRGLKVPS